MKIHEKIRLIRQHKGWSQEQMATYLGMSLNGYSNIERGETDIGLARLEQIASLLGVGMSQLFELNEDGNSNNFYFFGANSTNSTNSTGTNKGNSYCNFYVASNAPECDYLREKFELREQQILNEQKEMELSYLKEINELKEKEVTYLKEINELIKRQVGS